MSSVSPVTIHVQILVWYMTEKMLNVPTIIFAPQEIKIIDKFACF